MSKNSETKFYLYTSIIYVQGTKFSKKMFFYFVSTKILKFGARKKTFLVTFFSLFYIDQNKSHFFSKLSAHKYNLDMYTRNFFPNFFSM